MTRLFKLLLLLFMGFLLPFMASCPGLYDSRRSAIAHRHYFESPSQGTQMELEEAKRLNQRDILIYESVMAGMFALAVYAFLRAGRKVRTHVL